MGDEPGYNPTPEDLCLWEVYGDWVNANPGTHLDGGIRGDDAGGSQHGTSTLGLSCR